MTSQWPDNCDANTWQVISNSLDIDFIHGDIHDPSCKNVRNKTTNPTSNHRQNCFIDVKILCIIGTHVHSRSSFRITKEMKQYRRIYDIHKSQNAPIRHPTMHHSAQNYAQLCSEQYIVGYGTGTFGDLCDWFVGITHVELKQFKIVYKCLGSVVRYNNWSSQLGTHLMNAEYNLFTRVRPPYLNIFFL